MARYYGYEVNDLLAKIDYQPNTNGEKADKYIEIDLSQQLIYLFENGKRSTTYKISSGLYYPTPKGEFQIMNKAINAYSDIYHVYMPYWMAFYYSDKIKAYFGIHELPYWVDQSGKQIQRPREFIGSPHTGGCVALDPSNAKDVYDFATIGMKVFIFE